MFYVMVEQIVRTTQSSWVRLISRVIATALIVGLMCTLLQGQPAIFPSSISAAASAKPTVALEAINFSGPSIGLGVFTRESASDSTCTDFVGKSTDGGATFNSLVHAMSWNCANADFSSTLISDDHGDLFLYGPRFYLSHDDGKTWIKSTQPGSVLDVDAVGRSVWMVESACSHAETASSSLCPIRLLESTNGGRTWKRSGTSPSGASNGVSGGAHGQSYLVRVSQSRAYLMLAPSNPIGGSSVVPLWFTSNGGRSWSNRQVPCHMGALSSVLSVAPSGALMAVCASQPSAGSQLKSVLESTNGGRTWTLKTKSNIDYGYLGEVDLVTSQKAFLVGGSEFVARDV